MTPVVATTQQMVAVQPQAAAALERIKSLVLDSVRSPHTRRAYDRVLSEFLAWCVATRVDGFTKATVQSYRAEIEARGLSASAVNVQLAAIRKLAAEAADNGFLSPELAAGHRQSARRPVRRTPGRELAYPRPGQPLVSAAGSGNAERQARSRHPRAADWLRAATRRARAPYPRGTATARRTLGDCGPAGEGKTAPDHSCAQLGQTWIDEWLNAAGVTDGCVFRAINKGGRLYGHGLTASTTAHRVVHDLAGPGGGFPC